MTARPPKGELGTRTDRAPLRRWPRDLGWPVAFQISEVIPPKLFFLFMSPLGHKNVIVILELRVNLPVFGQEHLVRVLADGEGSVSMYVNFSVRKETVTYGRSKGDTKTFEESGPDGWPSGS